MCGCARDKEAGGKAGGGLKQTAKQGVDTRYFVLTPLFLRYYNLPDDRENDLKPAGVVNLAGEMMTGVATTAD
jgi:hypothetical protein